MRRLRYSIEGTLGGSWVLKEHSRYGSSVRGYFPTFDDAMVRASLLGLSTNPRPPGAKLPTIEFDIDPADILPEEHSPKENET